MDHPFPYSPASIERLDEFTIRILWTDGQSTDWNAQQLRDACPCATCREKQGKTGGGSGEDGPQDDGKTKRDAMSLPVLSPAEARPMRIEGMRPVGTYAYNIAFSDGHSSGLFTLARLRRETIPS